MELRQIKELMVAMERNRTKRLHIKQENFELELECETSQPEKVVLAEQKQASAKSKVTDIPTSLHPPVETPEPSKEKVDGQFITSPMVGTFYSASGPDEPAFVKAGDMIDKETVVGIVEAMKVMNEIKSGVSGTVMELLVENGHPVEFGTKLFKITK